MGGSVFLLRANLILVLSAAAIAQTPPSPLSFEVASVKPSRPLAPGASRGTRTTQSGIDFGGATLRYCVGFAYRVKDYQVTAPAWMSDLRFDIVAKASAGSRPSPMQLDEMLQTLLAERFHLRIHRETKEIPGLALVVAKGGLKLKERTTQGPGSGPSTASSDGPPLSVLDAMSIPMPGVNRTVRLPDGGMRLVAGDAKMSLIAGNIGGMLGTPVFDLTDATGTYDVVIDASRDDVRNQTVIKCIGADCPQPNPGELAAPPGMSIFDSLLKLGLRLEPRKGPTEIIVVDSADKTPSGN
jgi:uncharacterized protein (TIGR03435 family)